jgi:hypothetical protein
MVRLVFRPYTRLRRSICTSESLRTSTRVSPGFVLAGHRSPSFGSQHVRSWCACPLPGEPSTSQTPRGCAGAALDRQPDLPSASKAGLRFHYAFGFNSPETRAHVRLLGPCFKTGQGEPQSYSPQTTRHPANSGQQESYNRGASYLAPTTGRPKSPNQQSDPAAAANHVTHPLTRMSTPSLYTAGRQTRQNSEGLAP